jgi:YVTN family beta-propeller protein
VIAVSLVLFTALVTPVSSGNIAINPAATFLAVANPDSNSISVVTLPEERLDVEIAVGKDPRCVAWALDGNYVLVTNQASDSVSIASVSRGRVVQTISVDAEPYGIVVHPGRNEGYVASSAANVVDVIRLYPTVKNLQSQVVRRIPVGPRPRGLALSADGTRLYVTHFLSGTVSVIDTSSYQVVQEIATGLDSNMAQKIAIHPSNGRAYLPHIRSNVINRFLLFDTAVFPVLSAIDLTSNKAVPSERVDLSLGLSSVNLPFDVVFSSDGRRAYVVNLGSEDLVAVDLATSSRVGVVDVGNGPRGIAVALDGGRAYVSNSLSDDISVVDLRSMSELKRIRVTTSPLPPQVRRGEIMFFSSRSSSLSRDRWMSCASCHFEGEHDGRTWQFTSGPRNTTSLRGVAKTLPLHWSADRDEVQDFEHTIRTLQAGSGLIRSGVPNLELGAQNSGLSEDLDALAAFVNTLMDKRSPFAGGSAARRVAIQSGKRIFERPDVGCTQCHVLPRYTDSTMTVRPFILHDVGTGDGPDEHVGSAFDTPALRGVWQTAPYLHDGSAVTLRDVLTTRNPRDLHGRTSHLTEKELQDLIVFLMSL